MLGSALGCEKMSTLGRYYRDGIHDIPQDLDVAHRLFLTGCDQGHGLSCHRLALLHYSGHGLPEKDYARATSLMTSACNLGDLEACTTLGRWQLENAPGGEVPKQAGDLHSWYRLNLTPGHRTPELEEAWEKALALSQFACDADYVPGCYQLGEMMWWQLHEYPNQHDAATGYLEFACEANHALACRRLGLVFLYGSTRITSDEFLAREFYEHACDLGAWEGCHGASMIYDHNYPKPYPHDPAYAYELSRIGCDMTGSREACELFRQRQQKTHTSSSIVRHSR